MDKILMYNKNFLLGISSVNNLRISALNLRLPALHASKECFSYVHVSMKNVFTFERTFYILLLSPYESQISHLLPVVF